jgi:lambda repressor-like predicted transcriptional regulator
MGEKPFPYQPGVILYDVIIGLLRVRGVSFADWCDENGIHQSSARNAIFGQSGGPRGQQLLEDVIKRAGQEMVARAYADRVHRHADRVAAAMKARGWT